MCENQPTRALVPECAVGRRWVHQPLEWCAARVWDAAGGAALVVLAGHGAPISSAGFGIDGARVLTGSWDDTTRVWDATSGEMLAVLAGLVLTALVSTGAVMPALVLAALVLVLGLGFARFMAVIHLARPIPLVHVADQARSAIRILGARRPLLILITGRKGREEAQKQRQEQRTTVHALRVPGHAKAEK